MHTNIDTQELKRNIDFPAIVSQFFPVTRVGNNYACRCPFHEETNPSFYIFDDHAFCFGCSWQGDVIKFIQDVKGLGFFDTLEWLRTQVGELPLKEIVKQVNYSTPILPIVIRYWHKLVNDQVRGYYHSRLLTDETIDLFLLGWDGKNYVIPWWEGKPKESLVYGVKFRTMDGKPSKYLTIKGRGQPRLFNKWMLRDTDWACIFFGEFDAILAHQDGFPAVSPTSGQNSWCKDWDHLFDHIWTIYIIPDVGEQVAGYRLASRFGDRAVLCSYPSGVGNDYTEFRQNGYSPNDFRVTVLTRTEVQPHFVKSYWNEGERNGQNQN